MRSCSLPLCLSHSVISYRCAHGLMPSGSLAIVFLCSRALMLSCCRALILPYDHNIKLAWHHAPMLSCSHTRGVIMLLHFPAPTPSCPHALNHLQSLTCKETLPHCLASRSLIVQVLRMMERLGVLDHTYFMCDRASGPSGVAHGGHSSKIHVLIRF